MADMEQWNVRGLRASFEELKLLCNQYNPQVVAVSGITKSSPGDNVTGGITLRINKSVLLSEIELDTDLQAVAVKVSAKKTVTVCNVYLHHY